MQKSNKPYLGQSLRLRHENEKLPVVFSEDVKGGRGKVQNLTELYTLITDFPEWLDPFVTVMYVTDINTDKQLIDLTNAGNASGWRDYKPDLSAYATKNYVIDYVVDEQEYRQNADAALQTAIDNEVTARQNSDAALQGQTTANATAITNEVTARQNADAALQGQITANTTAISNEVTNRQNAVSNLQGQITTNAGNITAEATARQTADAALQDQITANANAIAAAGNQKVFDTIAQRDAFNVTKLPFSAFIKDDGDGRWALYQATALGAGAAAQYVKISDPDLLNAAMTAAQIKAAYESNPDTNAFTNDYRSKLDNIPANIATRVDNEATARQTADDALQGQITANTTAISNEATARQNAVTSLQGQITANATSISNEVTARQNADTALQGQISTNATAISTEITNRQNADTALQGQISAEVTARQNAISGLSAIYQPLEDQRLSTTALPIFQGVKLANQSAPPTPTSGFLNIYSRSGSLAWINTLGYERRFTSTGLTADRAYTLQDKSYTLADDAVVAHLAGAEIFSGAKTFAENPFISNNNPTLSFINGSNNSAKWALDNVFNNYTLKADIYQPGGLGKAAIFNGSNSYGTFNDASVPNSGNFTIAYWVKAISLTANTRIFHAGDRSVSTQSSGVGKVQIITSNATMGSHALIAGGVNLNLNLNVHTGLWNHIAFTYNSTTSTATSFVNGVQRTTGTGTYGFSLIGLANIGVGYTSNSLSGYFNGTLDQFLIYNRALSAAEINNIYNKVNNVGIGTPSIPLTGLAYRYEFDEGAGTTSADSSVNGYTMTMTNFTTASWEQTGRVSFLGGATNANPISHTDGVLNGEKGQLNLGDIAGGVVVQAKGFRAYMNNKNPFAIGLDGHALFDPAYLFSPDTNGSVNPFSNLTVGAGTATVSQFQFTDSALVPTFSVNTAGSLQRNANALLWNDGSAWRTLLASVGAIDHEITDSTKGLILLDRGNSTRRRLVVTNGVLATEAA